ncbi:protein VACUOLELESS GAMETOPHYTES-like [Cornus florida]|uniref:protein VACUOLELESS GAMETOPHYTES-like n=1 Tax=Cornus florida TaxID=4283 RepID=UPI0028A0C0BE|nr:protein VACUOLELESS GAMETOPHYTES-like [Cornus florida]
MAPLMHTAPPPAISTLQHFTHPKHPLHEVYMATEYNCDGCNTLGFGTRYRCATCDFDLHEICATCPLTLPSQLHSQHQLTLVNRAGNGHFCDLCGELANGMFYTCSACDFDVHPLCTQLPLSVQHVHHPQHLLKLQPANPSWCALCLRACTSWRYRCDVCNVDVHLDCVLRPSDVPSGPVGQSCTTWAPPCVGGYSVGVPFCGYGGMNQPTNQVQGGGPGGVGNGRNGRKIYSIVGKLAVKTLVTSIIGFPISFGNK